MLKKVIITLACVCIISIVQAQVIFNKVYDSNLRYDGASAVIETFDGGFLIAGNTFNLSLGYMAVFIIKTDTYGDTAWTKEYNLNSAGGNWADAIIQLIDSNYIICGTTVDSLQMKKDAYLLKLDVIGNIIWFKKYGTNDNDAGYDTKQTSDEGFVIGGWSQQPSGFEDAFLVKTDSLGNEQWQQHYGGGNGELVFSVDLTEDGGYILGGTTYSPIAGTGTNTPPNMYLAKTDSLGNLLWQKPYGTAGIDYGQVTKCTMDSGFILVGGREVSGDMQGYIVKTNSSGIVQWTKTISTSGIYYDWFDNVLQLPDSSYLINGTTEFDNYVGWLVKCLPNGDTIFTKKYRYYPDTSTYHPQHYFYNMDLTSDGGAVMCGMTINNPLPQKNDFWVVKVDSLGCADTSCTTVGVDEFEFQKENQLIIYPNPNNGTFSVAYYYPQNKNDIFEVFDINGRRVFSQSLPQWSTLQMINLPELTGGIYNCVITSGYERMSRKVAIIKE